MGHVIFLTEGLNFPYTETVLDDQVSDDFWREVLGCLLCRAAFFDKYRHLHPEIISDVFWDEVKLYLADNHLTLRHISDYLRAEVMLHLGGDREDQEKFDSEFLHTYCHFLICSRCSKKYQEIHDRVCQVNGEIRKILNPS